MAVRALFCIVCLCSMVGESQVRKCPEVKPTVANYHFPSAQEAKVRMRILSASASPLYLLECYSHSVAPQTNAFDFSGDFECALHSLDKSDRCDTLLTENPDCGHDWESRGRFFSSQLLPPCGDSKELGRVRNFRLREFRLTLSLSLVVFDKERMNLWKDGPALKSFDLKIEVASDDSAVSRIAAMPKLPSFESLPPVCREPFDSLYLSRLR